MIITKKIFFLLFVCFASTLFSQTAATAEEQQDSSVTAQQMILALKEQHKIDSLVKIQLQIELTNSSTQEKLALEKKIRLLTTNDSLKKIKQLVKIEELKKSSKNYPVVLFADTILYIYTKTGSFTAKARASAITARILKLYKNDFLNLDSLKLITNENSIDIAYKDDDIIMSITELDGMWLNTDKKILSAQYLAKIKKTIVFYKDENMLSNVLKRVGQVAIIIACLGLIVFFINKLFKRTKAYLVINQEWLLNGLTIKKFQIFTAEKYREFAFKANNIIRIFVIVLLIYLSLPLIFSVFPETKPFTDTLLNWIISPAKNVLMGFLGFLPNLFTIVVIYYITKWTIKVIGLFFTQIQYGNVHLSGFHKDWAMPTFNILKFILYAFMVVVIFPYLPGSDSAAFQGISVFIGVLFSLGSSSAITNMIAGLVITYMRPFKIGDRVKIGEVVGDVLEKTMLVTRIKTIFNQEITVPNSTILSSHTINYSSNAQSEGLILNTTVTIGYDVPWKKVHEALIKAADRTEMIMETPKPFVFQISLDDFYVAYEINVHTKEANKQAVIYSALHTNIQDCFNEAGIEILSPHYRASRDGSATTIPTDYVPKE